MELTGGAGDADRADVAVCAVDDSDGLLGSPGPGTAPSVGAQDEGQPIASSGGPPYTLSVPLSSQDRLYGTAVAVRARLPFTHEDSAMAHFAARLATVHVRHARDYAQVRATAMYAVPGMLRTAVSDPPQGTVCRSPVRHGQAATVTGARRSGVYGGAVRGFRRLHIRWERRDDIHEAFPASPPA